MEDMLINDNSIKHLRPGYEVLKRTHDGMTGWSGRGDFGWGGAVLGTVGHTHDR